MRIVSKCGAAWPLLAVLACVAGRAAAQDTSVKLQGDSVRVRFVDTDLRAVLQAVSAYMPRPLLASGVPATRVSLETPRPVSPQTLKLLVRGLVEAQGLQFTEDSVAIHIAPKVPEPTPPATGLPALPPVGMARGPQTILLHVVRLRHAIAADVAATVNQLYGGSGDFAGRGGAFATGTLSDELRRSAIPPDGGLVMAPGSAAGAPRSSLSGPIVIVPDQLTNALLVRASSEDFEVLQ